MIEEDIDFEASEKQENKVQMMLRDLEIKIKKSENSFRKSSDR